MRSHVDGQDHGDGRSLVQGGIAVYCTAVQFNDGVNIGKAVAVARARRTPFGSVKPFEDMPLTIFRHADARIGDSQLNTARELSLKRNGD